MHVIWKLDIVLILNLYLVNNWLIIQKVVVIHSNDRNAISTAHIESKFFIDKILNNQKYINSQKKKSENKANV